VNIKIGEHIVDVQIDEQLEFTSKYTGLTLEKLKVEFRVRGKSLNDEVLDLLESAKRKGIDSVDEEGNIINKWKIGNSSWSFTEGNPIFTHTLELQEIEDIKIEILKVGNLELKPYLYKEEIYKEVDGEEKLKIQAKVAVTEEEHNELKKIWKSKESFQVVRIGINEEPQNMEIEVDGWSKFNESYKHYLSLSEKKENEDNETKSPFPILGWVGATTDQTATNIEIIDGLFKILEQKGLLSSEEISQIRTSAEERQLDRKYELHRFEDIDKFGL
jgi:hypothetical protein